MNREAVVSPSSTLTSLLFVAYIKKILVFTYIGIRLGFLFLQVYANH